MVHRAKMNMKNVEVGVDGVVGRKESSYDFMEKKKIEPNPMEYTFYVRKSNNNFY